MDLLEKNLKLLEQHYPGIRKNLDEAEEQQDGLRVFEEQSEDCEKILKILIIFAIWRESVMQNSHLMNGWKNRNNFRTVLHIFLWA